MATLTLPETGIEQDAFPINGTDYVEFYVGNAKQASHYYRAAFGYSLVAYRGPETGVRDRASYLLQQGREAGLRDVVWFACGCVLAVMVAFHEHPTPPIQ